MNNYDPEIDPTIREEEEEIIREAEERKLRELRREELRSVLNDLLDERDAKRKALAAENQEENNIQTEKVKESQEEEQQERPFEETQEQKANNKKSKRSVAGKTVDDIISGGILSNPKVRRYYPYLIGFGVLIVVYLMSWFSVQRLQHRQQVLEKELRTLRTEAVTISSEAKQKTNRSNIVKLIEELGLDLEESTEPLKVIEK